MARNKKVKVDGFGAAVMDIISAYQEDVTNESKTVVQSVAEKTAQKVRDNITAAGIGGTKYKNSIEVKRTKGRLISTALVYSPKHYQLTHLLENGHKVVLWGTPTNKRSRDFPHWKPAEEWAIEEMQREIEEAVQK